MARYYLNPSDNYFFHYDRAPMRLFHINDRLNEFGVAFGVETSNVTCGGIRLFLFSNAWQYYSSLYYQTNCHPEIKEVGNLYNTDNLYILSKDNIHNNGLTAFLSPSSTLPNVTLMSDSNYTYNSLTQIFAGNHIDISGHNGTFVFHIFDQDDYLLSEESCFNKEVHEYETLPNCQGEKEELKWKYLTLNGIEWNTIVVTPLSITTNSICEKCD